jgi:hypothetical protein
LVWVASRTTGAFGAQEEVIAEEAVVRSAPFDVAPELARVHAGAKLFAEDQAQGAWRRVRLPDGRCGFLKEADAKVSATAPLTSLCGPGVPTVAPPIAAAPAAAPVDAAASSGLSLASASASGASPPSPAPKAALESEVPIAHSAPPPSGSSSGAPVLFGVMFEILPVGTLKVTGTTQNVSGNLSSDSQFAVGVAPALDVSLTPYFALGLSPQVVFRVRADGATGESSTEYDLRGRVTLRAPLSPSTRVFTRVSPAYSIISLPAPMPGQMSVPDPAGFLVDVAVGAETALLPDLFAVVDLGYQIGFQSSSIPDGSRSFEGSRYLHLGAGLAVGF